MFVDASAIIAILAGESDRDSLARRLEEADRPITSPLALYEAVVGLARARRLSIADVRGAVGDFVRSAGVTIATIDGETADLAIDAAERYGKGTGHPARLNMGDCFAYAVARQHRVPLLYKGDDFARTDVG